MGVQKAIGALLDGLSLKAVTIAGKIDAALIVDVGSLKTALTSSKICQRELSYKRTGPIKLA